MSVLLLALALGTQTLQLGTGPGDSLDETGLGRAFVELGASRPTAYLHEPVHLRLRLGIEERFLAESAIQPFGVRLDVPVQVLTGALQSTPCLLPRAGSGWSPDAKGVRFALDDAVQAASRVSTVERDGKSYEVLEVERTILPDCVGELVLPAPVLRYAYASRFTEDFLRGRVPLDRFDASVRGDGLALAVLPLPEAGRPADFGGAVGRFSIDASAAPAGSGQAGALTLTVRITGDGEPTLYDPPSLDGWTGFRVLGRLDSVSGRTRTITYDLVADRLDVTELPPVAFSFFDPEPPASYRTIRTAPIPIELPPPPPPAQAGPPADDGSTGAPAPDRAARRGPGPLTLVLAGAALVVLALLAALALRSRRPRS